MKKTGAVLLSASMLLALVGCGGTPTSTAGSETAETPQQGKQLNVLAWDASQTYKDITQKYIDEFEAEHPGVEVVIQYLPQGFDEKLMALYAANEAPDIFFATSNQYIDYADRGMLLPLDDLIAGTQEISKDDIIESAKFSYDDKLYGLAVNIQPQLLFYNKDMFAAANLPEPTDDWTWDDFQQAAAALTQKDENGKTLVYGFQCDEYWRYFSSVFWSNGGQYFDDEVKPTQVQFNNEIALKSMKLLDDMVTSGSSPMPGVKGALAYREAFANGKVAMILDGAWMVQTFSGNPALNYGIALPPKGDVTHASNNCGTAWVMSKNDRGNEDLAFDLWLKLNGKEIALELADYGSTQMGGLPCYESCYEDERWQPAEVVTSVEKALDYVYNEPYFSGGFKWCKEILDLSMQEMIIADKDYQTVLDDIQAKTESEILK